MSVHSVCLLICASASIHVMGLNKYAVRGTVIWQGLCATKCFAVEQDHSAWCVFVRIRACVHARACVLSADEFECASCVSRFVLQVAEKRLTASLRCSVPV